MDEMTAAWRRAWTRVDRRQIFDWARRLKLAGDYATTGPFRVERSRYLQFPFELLVNKDVRMLNILKAPRTGGSLVGDIFFHHTRRNAPGPFMWTFQSDDDGGEHWSTRIKPTIEENPALCGQLADLHQRRTLFEFPELNAYIQGANANSLQRKGIRYEINEEVWLWKNGLLAEAFARTDDYKSICKILNISQAGIAGDQWDQCCSAARRYDWAVRCERCSHHQPYEFFAKMLADATQHAGIIWDPAAHRANGGWDLGHAAATTRFRCRDCGHEHADTPASWHRFNSTGDYLLFPGDSERPMRNVTVRWTSLVNGYWADLVTEYLQALMSRDSGVIEPLKKFNQKKLNLPWDESQSEERRPLTTGEYLMGEPWPEAEFTFLTADYQEGRGNDSEHYWVLVRSWRRGGASRLRWFQRCRTVEEIDAIQARFHIKSACVCVDGGDRLLDIASTCASRGWTILVGDDPEAFPHKAKRAGAKPVLRAYSPRRKIDPHRGTKLAKRRFAYLFYWSNPSVKNILWRLRHGRGAKWELSHDLPADYRLGIDSELKFRHVNPRTAAVTYHWKNVAPNRFNHPWDCECMQIVCALIAGILVWDVNATAAPDADALKESKPPVPAPVAPHDQADQLALSLRN
jgi:hypothetical protein